MGNFLRARSWWSSHKITVLRFVIPLLGAIALLNLGHKFYVAVSGGVAIDLKARYEEVHDWFAGRPVYSERVGADYPPASYAILWPFLGWPTLLGARLLWEVTVLAMLLWLSCLAVRESGADTSLERAFVALLPLSINAAAFTLRQGQLSAHVVAALLAGLLVLNRAQLTWRDDVWTVLLMLGALVKPNISVPFFWIVLLVCRSRWPALFIGLGYVVLTLTALSFQQFSFSALFGWIGAGVKAGDIGYAHL